MEQKIIIRRDQYLTYLEDETIDKLKVDYRNTSFSTYDSSKPYLHIQVGDYSEFNLYVEMSEHKMEQLIKQLEEQLKEQLRKVRYGI